MGLFSRQKSKRDLGQDGHGSDSAGICLISGKEARRLLTPENCLAALEETYANLHLSPQDKGQSLAFATTDGVIHVKAGLTPRLHDFFAAKVNANYPKNPVSHDLPTIQGIIVLSECETGAPVAIIHSGVLTGIRTAAASALAAKHGARADSSCLAIIGCGEQSTYQAEAVSKVRDITQLQVFDTDPERMDRFARWAVSTLGLDPRIASGVADATGQCDICVTTTTSRSPILTREMVPSGCFIAAVGADNPDKHELDPEIFADAHLIVDDHGQCLKSGDLAHAVRAGTVSETHRPADLAGLVGGSDIGRHSQDEIVVFDSTGVGIQDVAAATAAYLAARQDKSIDRFCL